jgi:hypothetical protein
MVLNNRCNLTANKNKCQILFCGEQKNITTTNTKFFTKSTIEFCALRVFLFVNLVVKFIHLPLSSLQSLTVSKSQNLIVTKSHRPKVSSSHSFLVPQSHRPKVPSSVTQKFISDSFSNYSPPKHCYSVKLSYYSVTFRI